MQFPTTSLNKDPLSRRSFRQIMFNVKTDDADLYRLLCKISKTRTKYAFIRFTLAKRLLRTSLQMQEGKSLLQASDGENISLYKVVTYLSRKPVNVKHKDDKLSTCSVIPIWICRHSSHSWYSLIRIFGSRRKTWTARTTHQSGTLRFVNIFWLSVSVMQKCIST